MPLGLEYNRLKYILRVTGRIKKGKKHPLNNEGGAKIYRNLSDINNDR